MSKEENNQTRMFIENKKIHNHNHRKLRNSNMERRQLKDRTASSVIAQPITMIREPIARTISQFEHHMSHDRFKLELKTKTNDRDTSSQLLVTHKELIKLVTPSLCDQMSRHKNNQCRKLTNPLKCKANGWCSLFQNHQSESLAGAMSFSNSKSESLRRSSDQLLCSAIKTLSQTVTFFGIVEYYEESICLLLHTFHIDNLFHDCCTKNFKNNHHMEEEDEEDGMNTCTLFSLKTDTNSNEGRNTNQNKEEKTLSTSTSFERVSGSFDLSYQDEYLNNDILLAAMYEGNRIDCEVYRQSLFLFKERLQWMETEKNIPIGTFSTLPESSQTTLCDRAANTYQRLNKN